MMNFKYIYIIASLLAVCYVGAQEKVLELKNITQKQITVGGFILNSSKTVSIEAIGAGNDEQIKRIHNYQEDKFNLYAYAWILNSTSRTIVWRMTIDNTKKDWWDKWNRIYKGEIALPKGRYEIYYSTVEPLYFNWHEGFFSLGRLFDKIVGDDTWWEDHSKKWSFKISGVDKILTEEDIRNKLKKKNSANIVHITGKNSQTFIENAFTLKDKIRVEIYAIGEGYKGKMYDYGTLINRDTRQKLWEMREIETEYAGGAVKNRLDRQKITLNPGNYVVYYKSDGNHSLEEWNANPPYDPLSWGVSIKVDDKEYNPESIKRYSYKKKEPFIQLTRVGDDEYLQRNFKLEKSSWIKIWAIGEGDEDEMNDYGWITNASTGETVWRMDYYKTENAGGASKNRESFGSIYLDKGTYTIHYRTDDSHSYEEWNSRPPDSPGNWGISLFMLSDVDSNSVNILTSNKSNDETVLAQLIKIGDEEHQMKQLILKKSKNLHILCIGEGRDGEMFDYGWIENMEFRETVWRMNYRETQHAGGARKNRKVDSYITLQPGTYRLHYRSDDSHSYKSWNSDSPDDINHWGITVYEILEK